MIRGHVTARLEAKITVKLFGTGAQKREIEAIVDTGFTGSLALPTALVAELGLARRYRGTAQLADGSTCTYETYIAAVEWGDGVRRIVVSAVGNEVLAGMSLLAGHRLVVDVKSGGAVEVLPLS